MICPNCLEKIRGANKRKVRGTYLHKCRPKEIRDKELTNRLKQQYVTALTKADYDMITNLITPAFWKIFTKHFEGWSKNRWSSLKLQTIDEVSPDEKGRLKNYYMNQVLLNEIKPNLLSKQKGDT